MFHEIITQILGNTLELRDREAAGHSQRVSALSLMLGRALGLADHDMMLLRTGTLLHDIGKIGIPDSILLKPAALTREEWAMMRQHPNHGADLISKIPNMQDVVPIVLYHHEKWDGTGYPNHLVGENIPYLARVCAIAEVFDSLLSDQAFRPAWPKARVLQWLGQEAGKAFDPSMVASLSNIANRL